MSQIIQGVEENGVRARGDRRWFSGQVVSLDATSQTCVLDTGAPPDGNGNPVYYGPVPYNPATPPTVGDVVTLAYSNTSDQSVSISGHQVSNQQVLGGGSNASQQILSGATNAVTSVYADSGAKITGAVQLVSGTNIVLTESGQAITINASASVTGISAESGGGAPVGPESVLNFISGTNVSSITVADDTSATPHRIDVTFNCAGVAQTGRPFGGAIKKTSAPYSCANTDTFVYVTGGSGNITLPQSSAVGTNATVVVRNATTGTTFTVVPYSGDVFDDTSSTTSASLNPRGSAAYIGYIFITDGAGHWYSMGFN